MTDFENQHNWAPKVATVCEKLSKNHENRVIHHNLMPILVLMRSEFFKAILVVIAMIVTFLQKIVVGVAKIVVGVATIVVGVATIVVDRNNCDNCGHISHDSKLKV